MYSKIYEIRWRDFRVDEWASESEISDDGRHHIYGVEHYGIEDTAEKRYDAIEHFFMRCFPDRSFEIVRNIVGRTAMVMFTGNIEALYARWMNDIKAKAAALDYENVDDLGLHYVREACSQPFGLSSKFYLPDWNGCTVDADDFLSYLRHLGEENDGKPFCIYIGQVFNYHF